MQEVTELSGWAVTILFCVTVVLPFWHRWRAPDDAGFLARMTTHFTIGFAIAGLSLLHAVLAVASTISGENPFLVGLAIATVGLFIAFGQVGLGVQLRRHRDRYRPWLLTVHLVTMLTLAAIGIAHLLLDGEITRCLLRLSACTT
ncbi:MAG: hypothetical protein ACREQM_12700 [Candidatus Dormibacteraceae bacterium]